MFQRNNKRKGMVFILCCLVCICVMGCSDSAVAEHPVDGEMEVHFIDVGNADATLFIQGDYTMLYDAATKSRGDDIVLYLQELGIEYLDVLVLTHPHDDHMGGASVVLDSIEIGTVYAPDILDIQELDSRKWFNALLDSIDAIDAERNNGGSIWHFPQDENENMVSFYLGDAKVEFLAPLEGKYSDFNDYSICARISYGDIDVMMTGDATDKVEKQILDTGKNVEAEVFQASHHGSDTGNSEAFIEEMQTECVVISCGVGNQYQHPKEKVMNYLEEEGLPVYRTDEQGTIIMVTNGTDYGFNVEPGTYISGDDYAEMKVK